MGTCLLLPLTLDYHNSQRKDKWDFNEYSHTEHRSAKTQKWEIYFNRKRKMIMQPIDQNNSSSKRTKCNLRIISKSFPFNGFYCANNVAFFLDFRLKMFEIYLTTHSFYPSSMLTDNKCCKHTFNVSKPNSSRHLKCL